MRKALVIVVALTLAAGIALPAAASTGAKKKPVKLEGKVNNKGTEKVKDGAIEISADDFFFDATFIKGAKGETVAVTITNDGGVQHTFTIDSQDIDETIDPGDSVTVDVEVRANGKPAPGYCAIHLGEGMKFAFFSKSGGKARSEDKSDDKSDKDTSDDDTPTGGYGY
jgi:plastocyanin